MRVVESMPLIVMPPLGAQMHYDFLCDCPRCKKELRQKLKQRAGR